MPGAVFMVLLGSSSSVRRCGPGAQSEFGFVVVDSGDANAVQVQVQRIRQHGLLRHPGCRLVGDEDVVVGKPLRVCRRCQRADDLIASGQRA
jgi:hypothetical protein